MLARMRFGLLRPTRRWYQAQLLFRQLQSARALLAIPSSLVSSLCSFRVSSTSGWETAWMMGVATFVREFLRNNELLNGFRVMGCNVQDVTGPGSNATEVTRATELFRSTWAWTDTSCARRGRAVASSSAAAGAQ